MSDKSLRPTAHFVVGEHEGRKVFTLGNIRFAALPVEIVTEGELQFVDVQVFRQNGAKLSGMVRVSMDYPNGVAGTPPHFDLWDMGLRSERTLLAERFETGDLLYLTNLPYRFAGFFLLKLLEQTEVCKEYVDRYEALDDDLPQKVARFRARNGRDPTVNEMNSILVALYRSVDELFTELKDRTDLPELFELREKELA